MTLASSSTSTTEQGAFSDEQWSAMLAAAIEGRWIRPVFQPIVDLQRRAVVGYEALTRFDMPDSDSPDPSSPDSSSPDSSSRVVPTTESWFLAAHRLGVGSELEAATLSASFRHRASLPPNCFMTVNIDPSSLSDDLVQNVLRRQGHLGGVFIEITEHRGWDWLDLAPALQTLRDNGAMIAVDDTGAGYSGLRQILELRPSLIKLDRALISGLDNDEAKVALVEMIGKFANRIDAWLLAEGVETIGEAKRLIDLEVPLAQGYVFGRPTEAWSTIDMDVAINLTEFAGTSGDSVRRLLDPVPAVHADDPALTRWLTSGLEHAPVLDHNDRPIGMISTTSNKVGEILPALIVNVDSSPADVAQRLSTGDVEPNLPVIAIDNAGRYLGTIGLRRLLGRLSAPLG